MILHYNAAGLLLSLFVIIMALQLWWANASLATHYVIIYSCIYIV